MIKSKTVLVKDKRGIPCIMERVEKCLHRDVDPTVTGDAIHPMFIIRDKVVDAIYLPKYISSMVDGIPYSLPLQTPATGLNFDEVIECHRLKGDGWHTMTAVEWKFIEDCINLSGKEPHGNTHFGRYHANESEKGIPSAKYREITLTGSGPDTWYTGHSKDGIADFVGDVWKIVTGMRMVDGKIQYIKNNDAAAPDCDMSENSAEWADVLIDGKPLKASFADDEVCFVATDDETVGDYGGSRWKDVEINIENIPDYVKALGIFPAKQADNDAIVYVDTEEGERVPLRGGSYHSTSHGGSSALGLNGLRSHAYGCFGFFSAYYEVKADC